MRNLILFVLVISGTIACRHDSSQENSVNEASVTLIENPVEGNSSLPRLFSNENELFMSWIEQRDSLSILKCTKYENNFWYGAFDLTSGTDWFVNWADFPGIAVNNHSILTSYLQKSDTATYAYDIRLNLDIDRLSSAAAILSTNRGVLLHNDSTKTEHGFVSMVPHGKSGFFVSWLDGRKTSGTAHGSHEDHGGDAMTLRGAEIDEFAKITNDTELDPRVCDCCQTSATITQNGPLVAYRDRSKDEIRDISVVRQVNGQWLHPQTIGDDNWQIAGCPVNGPSVDSFKNSVAVAWFTAARGEGEVQVCFSKDNGAAFQKPIRLDSGNATGRVDLVMLNALEAVVLWMEPDGENELLQLMKITSEGIKGNPITITKTSAERASGFPQLEKIGNRLMIAWTDVSGEHATIKTATLSLDKL